MAKRRAAARKQKPARTRPRLSSAAAASARAKNIKRAKSAKRTATNRKSSRPARKAARPMRAASSLAAARKKPAVRGARPKPAALQRERRRLLDEEIVIPSAPSTLGYVPKASGAESGHAMYQHRMREHNEPGPSLTGGDLDADWNEAYSSGEEAPGGDTPTPDQDVVEEIGRALGVEYEDAEELKGSEKIVERDRHRWEYDPASAEDYNDRNKKNQ